VEICTEAWLALTGEALFYILCLKEKKFNAGCENTPCINKGKGVT